MRKSVGLQTKLISLSILTITLASCIFFMLSVQNQRALSLHAAATYLNGISTNTATELRSLLKTNSSQTELNQQLYKLHNYPTIADARIYAADGTVKAQLEPPTNAPSWPQVALASGMRKMDDQLITTTAIGTTPETFLAIQQNYKTLATNNLQRIILQGILFTLALLVALASLAALNNRIALRPLVRLSEFVANVQNSGNYYLQSPINSDDEIGELSKNINNMVLDIDTMTRTNTRKTQQLLDQKEKLENLANYDPLTGLMNRQFMRRLLDANLSHAKLIDDDFAVMYIDMDGFKSINDNFGHEFGDLLLINVSKIIQSSLGPTSAISRLSGDEFLILLPDAASKDAALEIAHKVLANFKKPIKINDNLITTQISIGVALASQAMYSRRPLISYADIAMHRAKHNSNPAVRFFSDEMLCQVERRNALIQSFTIGITNDQFHIEYQPKVNTTGKRVGYEALMRWNHPKLGNIHPTEFIPLAEASGRICELTTWLLHRVCRDLSTILARDGNEISVAINLSAIDIENKELLNTITATAEAYNVNFANLEFEITESACLQDVSNANRLFEQLRNRGATIALDDFGTGYSSLSYLTNLNIDTLKIDRTFIADIHHSVKARKLTKAIINTAKTLNFRICAEGVETPQQAASLAKMGCNYLQGYHFGKPTSIANAAIARLKPEPRQRC